jgi:hypothetical protein
MSNEIKRRKGTITLDEAKNRFNEYYNLKWDKPIGRKRAKLFDMMYQKKPKYTLVPGEPGSERYLLEAGPKTFDMKGVDYFPEGQIHPVPESNINVKSKGATYKIDEDSNDITTGIIGDDHPEVYGPRKDDKRLFNKYFKEMYDEHRKGDMFNRQLDNTDLKNKDRNNLVDIYWEQYRNKEHKRKNKKKTVSKFESKIIKLMDDKLKDYSAVEYNEEIYLIEDDSGEVYKKILDDFIMVYQNILDDIVPEDLKNIAFDEKILIRDSKTGKYIMNTGELLRELQNVNNGEYIHIYSNNRIYIYVWEEDYDEEYDDDEDKGEFVLQNDEQYDSLEEYIEIKQITQKDLIEISE